MELVFNVIAIKEKIGYASDYDRNGLFKVDMTTGECKFVRMFPNEDEIVNRLHDYAMWVENKVYFIPAAGDYLSVFNIETENVESIKIPYIDEKQNKNYNPKLKFTMAIEYNNFLWLIPATYPGLVRINISTNEVRIISDWVPENGYLFRRAVCVKKNKIYAASGNNNNVLIFNMDSEKGDIINVGKTNNGVMDMCEFESDFIMAPRKKGGVIRWNPESNIVVEYENYPPAFETGEIVFQYIYELNSQIILVPAHANYGIRLIGGNLTIDYDISWKSSPDNKLSIVYESADRVCFREYFGNSTIRFFFIEKRNNNLQLCYFNVINPDERLKAFARTAIENHKVVKETKSMRLEEWMKVIF